MVFDVILGAAKDLAGLPPTAAAAPPRLLVDLPLAPV